jgi:2-polyprenyl-6-methoxyphenol hydroxylase-like FAD-dependent oxidoreductase
VIIGGGPAGAMAGLLLARGGREVVVVEKKIFPRAKVCGEFIAPGAIEALERVGLGERFHAAAGAEIRRIALWTATSVVEAAMPDVGGRYPRALAREALDAMLLEEAERSGARLLQPAAALSVDARGVDTSAGRVEAKTIIAAHGSWERGALPTQAPRRASELFGFQAHFTGGDVPRGLIALCPFAGGYAGLVARRDGATLACCVRRDSLGEARRGGLAAGEAVYQLLIRENPQLRAALASAKLDGPWRGAGPLRPGRRAALVGGVTVIGNAAMEVHPVIGEGIAMALESAMRAVENLAPAGTLRRQWASATFARAAMHPFATRAAGMLLRVPGALGAAVRLAA